MPDFDPLYSTSRIDGIIDFVFRHYPFEDRPSCSLIQRGLNDVYLVKAITGERYVFRLSHRRARGAADVRMETEFLMHLARCGVPVARPVPTSKGALFVKAEAVEGPREGVLFKALDGRSVDAASAADAYANGHTLARLHDAAEGFSSDGARYRLDLEHLLHRPLKRILDSGVLESDAHRRELDDIAQRTERAILACESLTWTYCHGDCHGFNARIDDEGVAAFYDFDDGGPGYLAYDLSVFLWAKVSFGRNLTAMWLAFVEGYRSVRPIAPADFEAVHRFVIVRHIWLMGEYASRSSEWGRESIGWIAHGANFLRMWEEQHLDDRLF